MSCFIISSPAPSNIWDPRISSLSRDGVSKPRPKRPCTKFGQVRFASNFQKIGSIDESPLSRSKGSCPSFSRCKCFGTGLALPACSCTHIQASLLRTILLSLSLPTRRAHPSLLGERAFCHCRQLCHLHWCPPRSRPVFRAIMLSVFSSSFLPSFLPSLHH